MTDTPDWADGQASRFLETQAMKLPMDSRDVDREVLASALRAAFLRGRIDGLREAAEIARLRERVSTLASDAIRAAADELEKGEA